jgi:hypothetical protein
MHAYPWEVKGFNPQRASDGRFGSQAGQHNGPKDDRHNPDLDAAFGMEPNRPPGAAEAEPADERFPSRHTPGVDYANPDDRDSDDKHIDGQLAAAKQAHAEVQQLRAELAAAEKAAAKAAKAPKAPPEVRKLQQALKRAGAKAERAAAKAAAARQAAEQAKQRRQGAEQDLANVRGAATPAPMPAQPRAKPVQAGRQTPPAPGAGGPGQPPKPVTPGKPAGASPPPLPHHRSHQTALSAANAVVQAHRGGGDVKAAHASAMQALDAHLKAGIAELDRRGGNPKHKQAFAAKIRAARQKLNAMAGVGNPRHEPRESVRRPAVRGFKRKDLALGVPDWPWVVKATQDANGRLHGDDGRFIDQGYSPDPPLEASATRLHIGPKSSVDATIAAGGKELFRGVEDRTLVRRIAAGEDHIGEGDHGRGRYFSTSEFTARGYTGDDEQGGIVRAALKPGARGIHARELSDRHFADAESGRHGHMSDIGAYARALGFDYIHTDQGHHVILNPDVLHLQEVPHWEGEEYKAARWPWEIAK